MDLVSVSTPDWPLTVSITGEKFCVPHFNNFGCNQVQMVPAPTTTNP